jgi:hypothetical protein
MKLFLIAISLAVTLGSASAQSLRSQIEASNKRVGKYLMAKDVKGFAKYMKGRVAPGFKYMEQGHAMGFDQMCRTMEMGLGQMQSMNRADAKLLTVKEKGNTAVSTSRHTMIGQTRDNKGRPHTLSFVGTSQDTYAKRGGKWRLTKMAWLQQTMLLDGKPLLPGAPGK